MARAVFERSGPVARPAPGRRVVHTGDGVTVRDTDKGAAALIQRMLAAGAVEFGIAEKAYSTTHEGGSGRTVGEIAEIHEFGLGVPRRSFLADWFDENKDNIQKIATKGAQSVIKGTITLEQLFEQIGLWGVGSIQTRISNNIPPVLAPSTIARKGSSIALIDKGQLRSSISHRVKTEGGK